MGSETYCFICGAPVTNSGCTVKNIKLLTDIISKVDTNISRTIIESIQNDDIENIEYIFKENKNISNYIENMKINIIKISDVKKYNWLDELVFLHANGNIIQVKSFDSWERKFIDINKNMYTAAFILPSPLKTNASKYETKKMEMFDPKSKYFFGDGYVMHKACYKLKKNNNCEFKFDDIYRNTINYININKYQQQEVPWLIFLINDDNYLLENPIKNEINKERILKIKLPIKLKQLTYNHCIKSNKKKYIDRKSPSYPAQQCKNETKKGNDDSNWVSKPNNKGIYSWIKASINEQKGGYYYFHKYKKYKTKYLDLKILLKKK